MALDFTASGSYIDHGSAAVLDDLAGSANGLTVWAWVYRTANGGNQHVVTKDNSFPSGWGFLVDNAPGDGTLRFIGFRGATDANWTNFISAAGVVPLNQWVFVCATHQDSRATEVDLYTGSLTAPATEVSYSTAQNGSGAFSADTSASLYVGNLQRATTFPFLGRIARAGLVNRVLSLEELREMQFAPIRRVALVRGTLLAADYAGTGVQVDCSGSGNHGTVTAAPVATSDRPRWGRRRPWAVNAVAAPPATATGFYYAWRRRVA